MKILILFSSTILSVLQVVLAQDEGEEPQKLVLVKVASLNTVDANREFQKNVQLVQQQRALAAQIISKIDASSDPKEKSELQGQFDSLQKKLNENNQLMFKTYGFSLNRNYVLTVEKSHIHMWVTEEEAEALKKKIEQTPKKEETGFRSLFRKKK